MYNYDGDCADKYAVKNGIYQYILIEKNNFRKELVLYLL